MTGKVRVAAQLIVGLVLGNICDCLFNSIFCVTKLVDCLYFLKLLFSHLQNCFRPSAEALTGKCSPHWKALLIRGQLILFGGGPKVIPTLETLVASLMIDMFVGCSCYVVERNTQLFLPLSPHVLMQSYTPYNALFGSVYRNNPIFLIELYFSFYKI